MGTFGTIEAGFSYIDDEKELVARLKNKLDHFKSEYNCETSFEDSDWWDFFQTFLGGDIQIDRGTTQILNPRDVKLIVYVNGTDVRWSEKYFRELFIILATELEGYMLFTANENEMYKIVLKDGKAYLLEPMITWPLMNENTIPWDKA